MSKKRGFTLIELLVVIAIIALLLAILMPSLQKAKQLAQAVACSSQTRQLTMAWRVYSEDNEDKICAGNTRTDRTYPEQWVQRITQPGDTGHDSSLSSLEREIIGIQQGSLFPYTQDEKVYHCPADPYYKRVKGLTTIPDEGKRSPYRGFAVAGGMNGGRTPDSKTGYAGETLIKKIGQIPGASDRYVFVEEGEEGRGGHNWGAWMIDPELDEKFWWWDPISIWHGNNSVFGFADGHTESHKWRNDSTKDLADGIIGRGDIIDPADDLMWMKRGFIPK